MRVYYTQSFSPELNIHELCRLKLIVRIVMKIYPESAVVQLEFDKIKSLLAAHCKTDFAKEKAFIAAKYPFFFQIFLRIRFFDIEVRFFGTAIKKKRVTHYLLLYVKDMYCLK